MYQKTGLNPCCNGRYSMSNLAVLYTDNEFSLNPCCNGRYSMSLENGVFRVIDGLNPCCNGRYSMSTFLKCADGWEVVKS